VRRPRRAGVTDVNGGEGLTRKLIRAGMGTLGMRVLQAALGFGVAVFLARELGPQGIGRYGSIIALMTILLIPIQAGISKMLVREVARLRAFDEWTVISNLVRWSFRTVLCFTALISAAVFSVWAFAPEMDGSLLPLLILLLPSLPIVGTGMAHAGALGGLKRAVAGQAFDSVRNSVLILLLVSLWFGSVSFEAEGALILYAAASGAGLVCVVMLLRSSLSFTSTPKATSPDKARWLAATVPFVAVGGLATLAGHIDILALGFVSDAEQAGLFHIAMQMGSLMLFGLTAVGLAASPYFSSLYATGEMDKLKLLARKSSQAGFAFSACCAGFLWLAGGPIIQWAFGEEFWGAHPALMVISLAYMVQASTGASSVLLSMTGHESKALKATAVSLVIKLIVAAFTIPMLGALGAAISVVVYFVVLNATLRHACLRHVGVETFAFLK
jgi:O-antigen/teichoic acid export membrane protein